MINIIPPNEIDSIKYFGKNLIKAALDAVLE